MRQPLRHIMLLLATGGVMFFVSLGATGLWDDDEAIFSQAAWEMADRGDYIVPWFNGTLFPDKPALMYWFIILAYKVFGATEFAARFWSAIFGLGSVLLTYRLGCTLFSRTTGFWAGLILASSLNFDVVARAATPDALLIFFTTLAILCFVEGAARRRQRGEIVPESSKIDTGWNRGVINLAIPWQWRILSYAAMGMGVLDKGPIGVILPMAIIGMFLLCVRLAPAGDASVPIGPLFARGWPKRWLTAAARTFAPGHFLKTLWSMHPISGVLVVLAIAGPWYVSVGVRTHGEWLAGFFGVHNFGRFMSAMENHRGPFFYYVVAILIGFFPWSVFLTPSVMLLVKRIREHHNFKPGYILLACWVGVYLGIFSLASTKLPSYILPCYPALALLTAGFVVNWLEQPEAGRAGFVRSSWITLGIVGLAIMIVAPIVAAKYLQPDVLLGIVGLFPLAGGCVGLFYSERRRPEMALSALAVAAVLFSTSIFGFAAVRVDRYQTSAYFARSIREHATGSQPPRLGSFGYFRASLVFYAKEPIGKFELAQQVFRFFRRYPADAFVFTSDEEYRKIAAQLPADVKVLDQRPWFLRKKNVLLLGRTTGGPSQATPVADNPQPHTTVSQLR